MEINCLYDKHRGKEIYIVGTGPSLRVFPDLKTFMEGKISIGLNQAWRHFNPTYSITIHPELVTAEAKTRWIVKGRKDRDIYGNPVPRFELEDQNHYVFLSITNAYYILKMHKRGCALFQGGGVQTTAMHCAYRMGASRIYLIGVDMCSLDQEHHGHAQHVRWAGKTPEEAYAEYRQYARTVRDELAKKGVHVYTLSPFVGIGNAEEDYLHIKALKKIEHLPTPEDISGKRNESKNETQAR